MEGDERRPSPGGRAFRRSLECTVLFTLFSHPEVNYTVTGYSLGQDQQLSADEPILLSLGMAVM